MNRRTFLSTTGVAGAAFALGTHIAAGQSQPPRIRIGQIGTGHAHASGKLGAMRSLSDLYEVVGIAEPDAQRREAAQRNKAYEGLKWMTEEQLLNTKGLQAVAVETEVCDLLGTAERCIKAGKHIHLDKPAGESFPHYQRIRSEAARQKLTVQMGYMFRYNPAFQLCYQAVREGWLGNITQVHTKIGSRHTAQKRMELTKYKGGPIFELGCHLIDSLVKILGKPRKVSVRAATSPEFHDGYPDTQTASLEFASAVATVSSSFLEYDGQRTRCFYVAGDKGHFEIRPPEPPHVFMALDAPHGDFKRGYQDMDLPKLPRYDGEFIDLARVIRGEKQFEWSTEHDLAVQETVLLASGLPVS